MRNLMLTIGVVSVAVTALHAAEPTTLTADSIHAALREIQSRNGGTIIGSYVVPLERSEFEAFRADVDLGPFIESAVRNGEDAFVALIPTDAMRVARVVFFREGVTTFFSLADPERDDPGESVDQYRMLIHRTLVTDRNRVEQDHKDLSPAAPPERYKLRSEDLIADNGDSVRALLVVAADNS